MWKQNGKVRLSCCYSIDVWFEPHSHDEGKGKSRAIVGKIMSAPYRYTIGAYCTMLAYKGVHRWCL